MGARAIWASAHGGVLLLGLLGMVLISDNWAILIALVPTAFVLVFATHDSNNDPTTVLGGHLAALGIGWAIYSVLAPGVVPTSIEPMSNHGLRIVASALIALMITFGAFRLAHLRHSMAYVTTFTAAIGGFPTFQVLGAITIAILFVGILQAIRRRVGPEVDMVTVSTHRHLS